MILGIGILPAIAAGVCAGMLAVILGLIFPPVGAVICGLWLAISLRFAFPGQAIPFWVFLTTVVMSYAAGATTYQLIRIADTMDANIFSIMRQYDWDMVKYHVLGAVRGWQILWLLASIGCSFLFLKAISHPNRKNLQKRV